LRFDLKIFEPANTSFEHPENTIVDVGYYRIINLNFNNSRLKKWNEFLNIYNDYNVYPSPELDFLKDEGVEFEIIEGCWGDILDFDFSPELMEGKDEEGIRFYCKYVGRMFCNNLTSSFYMKAEEDFISHLSNELEYDNMKVYNNEARIIHDKQHNYHLSHISGFITSYMRLNVLEQLYEFEVEDIVKIVVDGIYFKEKEVELKNCFVYEEKEITYNIASRTYISNHKDYEYENGDRLKLGEWRENNKIELHLGSGGSGKTHQQIYDKGFINPCFYAPSWKLTRNKQKECGIYCNTIAKISSTDPSVFGRQRKFVNVLIVDEVSMMTEKEKQQIISNFRNCKIIFCGDIGFQLPPIGDEQVFQTKGMSIIQHNKNYRVKCDKLLKLLTDCREMMEYGIPIKGSVMKECETIKENEMEYDYIKDMILSSTHNKKDAYTEKYKDLEKYYITKSDRVYGRGEICLEKPNTENCKIQHSYTIHSIQGETAYGNLFIDMEKVYDCRMIYTAISRARYIHQIKLVV